MKKHESGTSIYDVEFTGGFYYGDIERGLQRSAIRVAGESCNGGKLDSATQKERVRLDDEKARAAAKAAKVAAEAEEAAREAARVAAEAAQIEFAQLGGRHKKANRFITIRRYNDAKTVTVDVEPTDTVADMKRKAARKLQISNRHQILTFDGLELVFELDSFFYCTPH